VFGIGGFELLVFLAVIALAVFGAMRLVRRGSDSRSSEPASRSGQGMSQEQRTVALVAACFVAVAAFFGAERIAESAGGLGWGSSEIAFVRIIVPIVALAVGAGIYVRGGKPKT
jgi:TM2 domain-containing membrane protein YozV